MKKSKKSILVICTGMLLLSGCSLQDNTVDKNTVKEVITSIYTPASLDAFNKSRDEYVKRGIITQDEANTLFHSSGQELTDDDLARTLKINRVIKSNKDQNSMLKDIYKVDASVKYKGKTVNFIVTLSVNDDGAIDGHNYQEY